MNITEVKVKLLGSPDKQFGFNHSTDANGEKDPNWMRMWDNDKREAINIPTEVFNEIKANPTIDTLGIKTEEVEAQESGKSYIKHTIVKYKPSEFNL